MGNCSKIHSGRIFARCCDAIEAHDRRGLERLQRRSTPLSALGFLAAHFVISAEMQRASMHRSSMQSIRPTRRGDGTICEMARRDSV